MDQAKEEVYETPEVESEDFKSTIDIKNPPEGTLNVSPDIDAQHLVPDKAFEVFAGKSYSTTSGKGGSDKKGGRAQGAADSESPADRLLRLRAEVDELAEDLNLLTAAKADKGDESSPGDVWRELSVEVGRLKHDLEGVATTTEFQPILVDQGQAADAQQELAKRLVSQVQELADKKRALEAGGSALQSGQDLSVELCYNPAVDRKSKLEELQALEARLTALERCVGQDSWDSGSQRLGGGGRGPPEVTASGGDSGGSAGSAPSLAATVRQLEALVMCLDKDQLDKLKKNAEHAKAELLAAAKERSKEIGKVSENARRVEALYNGLQRWEGTSQALPDLVSRLKTLQELHRQSASFSQRLNQLETSQDKISVMITSATASLEQMEQSLADNLATVAENIQQLDSRMKNINPSL